MPRENVRSVESLAPLKTEQRHSRSTRLRVRVPDEGAKSGVRTGPLSGLGLAEHHVVSRSLSEGPLGPPPKLEDPLTL
jgi:hypothetical protein